MFNTIVLPNAPVIELSFRFLISSFKSCFLIMSLIASVVNDSLLSLSQETDLLEKDNYATTNSETNNFDPSDRTFLIFQNDQTKSIY